MKRSLLFLAAFALLLCGIGQARADLIYNNGIVNNLSTALGDNAVIENGATNPTTLNILPNGSVNNATVEGSSYLNVAGGSVLGNLDAFGSSQVTVQGNFLANPLDGSLGAHDSSNVTLEGASSPIMAQGLSADGSSRLTIQGAEAISLSAAGNSTVSVYSLQLHNQATITATDSAHLIVNSDLFAIGGIVGTFGGSSTVDLNSGATFRALSVTDSANVTLTRSSIPSQSQMTQLSVSPFGTLSIYGNGFDYPNGELPVDTGTLTGTLLDGTPIDDPFTGGMRIFLNEPGTIPVPEPATLVPFGIGIALIAGYGWRRGKQATT